MVYERRVSLQSFPQFLLRLSVCECALDYIGTKENASLALNIRTSIILGPVKKLLSLAKSLVVYLMILFRHWDDAVAQMTKPNQSLKTTASWRPTRSNARCMIDVDE
jgi:hypothetical protein